RTSQDPQGAPTGCPERPGPSSTDAHRSRGPWPLGCRRLVEPQSGPTAPSIAPRALIWINASAWAPQHSAAPKIGDLIWVEAGAMPAKGVEERAAFADAMMLLCALIGAAVGLAVMLASRDAAMAFHGFIFLVAGALAAIFVLKLSFETTAPSQPNSEY